MTVESFLLDLLLEVFGTGVILGVVIGVVQFVFRDKRSAYGSFSRK